MAAIFSSRPTNGERTPCTVKRAEGSSGGWVGVRFVAAASTAVGTPEADLARAPDDIGPATVPCVFAGSGGAAPAADFAGTSGFPSSLMRGPPGGGTVGGRERLMRCVGAVEVLLGTGGAITGAFNLGSVPSGRASGNSSRAVVARLETTAPLPSTGASPSAPLSDRPCDTDPHFTDSSPSAATPPGEGDKSPLPSVRSRLSSNAPNLACLRPSRRCCRSPRLSYRGPG